MNAIRIITLGVLGLGLAAQDAPVVRIGTWNLEHFGRRPGRDGPDLRTDAQVAKIGELVRALGVAVLAVQEIGSEAALQKLCGHIGEHWHAVLGEAGRFRDGTGRISVGFVWDTRRVALLQAEELKQLPQRVGAVPIFHRLPVSAVFRTREGFDFRAITVHLKASRGRANERKRTLEVTELRRWLAALSKRAGEDRDIVVLGDFNHTYGAPAHAAFTEGDAVRYLETEGSPPTIVHFDEPIDHIAVTPGIREELVAGSRRVFGGFAGIDEQAWRRTYSDHLPVTAAFRAAPDGDPDATFSTEPAAHRLSALRGTPPATSGAFAVGMRVRVERENQTVVEGRLEAPLGDWVIVRTAAGRAVATPRERVLQIEAISR